MRRLFAGVVTALLLVGLIAPSAAAAMPSVPYLSATVPKVVVIVGPAGDATSRYRSQAREAAAIARTYTPDVTEIYSPNATWPAVRDALQGASLVIYMGHGNGWPSPYRNSLYPPLQNGFGLNPTANGDDYTHQYFGEARIRSQVHLAPDAVVLLNHLCYASGNSEPGIAEGTISMARQRVDNFAAGFISAGAAAVVAEAYDSPDYMVRAVLGGTRSIDSAWRHAPSGNGHVFAFQSRRSPGYVAEMDPQKTSSGFTRSIVLKAGLAPVDVSRGASGRTTEPTGPGAVGQQTPSLATTGLTIKTPRLLDRASAATRIRYRFTFAIKDRSTFPTAIEASVRWDSLDPPGPGTPPDAAPPAAASVGAGAQTTPVVPPDLGLVVPERLGDVVSPVKGQIGKATVTFGVSTPSTPGRYRLTVTLHDRDGVAYDPATQAMLQSLIVRVTAPVDAQIVAPTTVQLVAGADGHIDLWAANLGAKPWGRLPYGYSANQIDPGAWATVVGRWLPLGADDALTQAAADATVAPAALPPALPPGKVVPASLSVVAPWAPGDYLVVLDIETPEDGSLIAAGVDPTIVRVKVVPAELAPATPPIPGAASSPATSPTGAP